MQYACNTVHDGIDKDVMVLTLPLASNYGSTEKEDKNAVSILTFQKKF
jgi:hypothetical protein